MSHPPPRTALERATRIGVQLRELQAEVDALVMDLAGSSPSDDGPTGHPVAGWLLQGLQADHFKITQGDDDPPTGGVQIGWSDGENIWLSPGAITEALNDRPLKSAPRSTRAIGRALLDAGYLQPGPPDHNSARRVTYQVRIGNRRPRVWKPTRDFAEKIQEAREESLHAAIAKSPPDKEYWAEYADFARLDVEPPS
ncbi:MAG: hypothetical protein ACRDS9_28020 [Pseudonocardiaceae bacterium]